MTYFENLAVIGFTDNPSRLAAGGIAGRRKFGFCSSRTSSTEIRNWITVVVFNKSDMEQSFTTTVSPYCIMP